MTVVSASLGLRSQPSHENECNAEGQEAQVVRQLVRSGPDVVNLEDVVVDDSFEQIEQSPADQAPSEETAPRPYEPAFAGARPDHEQADNDEHVGRRVEDAIPEGIDLEATNGRRWMVTR